jgi:uncharacterized protein YdeI (YjbR/CyaY-like superfamily)
MKIPGLSEIENAKKDGRWQNAYENQKNVSIPEDFQELIEKNPLAQRNFNKLDKTGKYMVILPILKSTNSEKRISSINKAIKKLERN